MRYVSSLISGAMIFCVGAGVSFQHGVAGLIGTAEVLIFLYLKTNFLFILINH